MPSLAVRNIDAQSIEIIPKPYCYKLKYTTPLVTLLSIYIYTPDIVWKRDGNLVKLVLQDTQAIHSLQQIDNLCLEHIVNYRPFLKQSNDEIYLWFSPNTEVLSMYHSRPTRVFLHLKTIQKKTDLNIPVLYIINYE